MGSRTILGTYNHTTGSTICMGQAKTTPRTQLSGIREHYKNVETLTEKRENRCMHGELTNIEKSRVQQVSPTAMRTLLLQQIHRPLRHMQYIPAAPLPLPKNRRTATSLSINMHTVGRELCGQRIHRVCHVTGMEQDRDQMQVEPPGGGHEIQSVYQWVERQ